MSECKIEFDETTGAVTVGPGELPKYAFDGLDKESIRSISFSAPVTAPEDCGLLFAFCSNLVNIEGIEFLDTSETTSMIGMFANCRSLSFLDLSSLDLSKVESMYGMFSFCSNLASLNLRERDISQFVDRSLMFTNCPAGEVWEPILEAGGRDAVREAMKTQEPENPAIAAAMKAGADIAPKTAAPVQAR